MYSCTVYYYISDMERQTSASTNTSMDVDNEQDVVKSTQETEDSSQTGTEYEPHKHRTRSSSFDVLAHINEVTTGSSSTQPTMDFADASLLLGLGEGDGVDPVKTRDGTAVEPATLPSTMTFFLDMLSEEQRRVRHRHIPAVEGFRKLYKSEIKQDMAAARALNKRKGKRVGGAAVDEGSMIVDEEGNEVPSSPEQADVMAEFTASMIGAEHKGELPDTDPFVAPSESTLAFASNGQLASLMESTPFENTMRGGASPLRSPQLVESLTAFNPPRPQESTGAKTKHRVKRWESNPQDVEKDLSNYKKTVQRTRLELRKAEEEHTQIEAVASMVRTHFMNHLTAYREEMVAVNEQLEGAQSKCVKAAEEFNGKSMSTRGSSKTMKDIFATLKHLGEELDAKGNALRASVIADWRASGVGGIVSSKMDGRSEFLANGWILIGDKVETPLGEGTVLNILGPEYTKKATSVVTTEAEKPEEPKSADSVDNDAVDVDETKDDNAVATKETPKAAPEPSVEESILPDKIAVHLTTGERKEFNPTELQLLSPVVIGSSDAELAKRWENMAKSAVEVGLGHDFEGMNAYINEAIRREEREVGLHDDGTTSPKTVTQFDNVQSVLPFGAGIMNAPEYIRDYSSVVPVDDLEDCIRKTVYEGGIQAVEVRPVMPPSVRQFESKKEETNRLKIKVMQLRNRLGRQKRIRGLNERSLVAGKNRALKVEGLLTEMQVDLQSLKGRLQEELNELGIGNASLESLQVIEEKKDAAPTAETADGAAASGNGTEKRSLEAEDADRDSKRARVE